MNLLKNVKVDAILGYYAAGTTARTSDIIDMAGYDGVLFLALFSTIIENGTIHCSVQQDTDSAGGTMATVAGTAAYTVTAAAAALAKSCMLVDVYRPQERYLRMVVTPATQNAVIGGVLAVRYKGRYAPEAHTTPTPLKATQLVSPEEA